MKSNVVGYVVRRGLVPQSGDYLHQDQRSWSTITNRFQALTLGDALDAIDRVSLRCRLVRIVRRAKPSSVEVSRDDLVKANERLAIENLRLTDELESARLLLLDVGEIARRGAALKVRG